jgi:hypothetical protein
MPKQRSAFPDPVNDGIPARARSQTRCCHGLRTVNLEEIPERPGIYKVFRPNAEPPSFLPKSPAGRFKGQNPTVSDKELKKRWVSGAEIIYIGKAGGESQDTALRSRIRTLIEFGKGHPVAHWGGRYI